MKLEPAKSRIKCYSVCENCHSDAGRRVSLGGWLVAEAFVQNFRLETTVDGEIQAQKYAERTPERSEGALKEDVYFATTPFWWWWLVVVVGGWVKVAWRPAKGDQTLTLCFVTLK